MTRSRLVAAAALLVLATSAPTALALPADPGAGPAALTAASDGTTDRTGVRFHTVGSFAGPAARSEAFDISDRGVVVGAAAVPGSAATHAFVMHPETNGGRLTDLTPSDPRSTRAEAVNRSGAVAGTLGIGPDAGLPQPFVWRRGTGLEVLPLPPGAAGAQAVDINDAGTVLVVGMDSTGVGLPVGSFLWDPAARTYRTLPTTGTAGDGAVPIARTLDERGGVAGGLVAPAGTEAWHHTATVWEPRTLTPRPLAAGGGSDTFATDRNERGRVVGWRMDRPGTAPKAVYWPSADAAPVALPGQVAFEINNRDRIVGIRPVPGATGFPFAAVMWEPSGGGHVRTTDLGDQGLGSYANAVNSSGKTAGYVVTPGESNSYEAGGWWNPPRRG